ncbi:hypothetical protein F0562_018134 [Nyssa sinensis]|uniref:Rho termination factor-like N-terminal domain-containing protein n=1 Tax=Nyssa sinensis TaxID=561372 RepID=A0A5J4ZB03_9ASTE|nr:hypothetical protein F0562_018134 [Nyssa sinensis]
MDAVVFYPHYALRLPYFSAFSKPRLGKPSLSLKEIADGRSLIASRKDVIQLTVSSIRADGNRRGRPPRKSTAEGRTEKDEENKIPQSFDGKSSNPSNQAEIIALFRRIQSSISKGESKSANKRSSNSSEDDTSAESVLEVLRQTRKQLKEKTSNKKEDKVLTRRRSRLEKVQKKEEYASVNDLKLSRPPSNFVKRSPIPSPTSRRGKVFESKASSATAGNKELELQKVEEMKLPALKELAKSRGIKGYSKLKKRELVKMLRS